jgi:hypothetical protein
VVTDFPGLSTAAIHQLSCADRRVPDPIRTCFLCLGDSPLAILKFVLLVLASPRMRRLVGFVTVQAGR